MFTKLYLKDLHEVTAEILIVVIGVALVTAGFLFSSDKTSPLLILPLILLLGLAGFLPLISSFKLLSREWSNNTVYLVMTLPVSGAMILGAKMLVLLTQYIVGTLLIALSSYLLYIIKLYQYLTPQQPGLAMIFNNPHLLQSLLAFYISGLVFLAFLCCISFFSQITGKLSSKFSGLVTAATFIITLILSGKALEVLGTGSNELYHMMIQITGTAGDSIRNMNMSSLSYFVVAIILFILAAVIYDRKLEL
jgi:hypothetical protein